MECKSNTFRAYGSFEANRAPILHLGSTTHPNKVPLLPWHLCVSWSAKQIVFVPMVGSKQAMFLSCILVSECIQTHPNDVPLFPWHLWVSSSPKQIVFVPMIGSNQTVLLSCILVSQRIQTHPNEVPLLPWHLCVSWSAKQIVFVPMVRSKQKPCSYLAS